ncbi:MAG: hypothetical protein KAI63_03190, partial [Planctomycetes bacterium]|nr:hypothetical protein [Planctomycetota bacterium]
DESDNGFKIRGAFDITYPTSGITIGVNETMTFTWTTDGTVPDVILEYSMDDFATPKFIETVSNTGSYNWTVPDDISVGEITQIRISDYRDPTEAYDVSPKGFRIRGWFQVLTPSAAGIELMVAVPYNVTWNTNGTMLNVTVQWSKVGDFSDVNDPDLENPIVVLTDNVTGTNSYSWDVPDQITAGFTGKVRVFLTGDLAVKDVSDDQFKIKSEIVSELSTKAVNEPPNQIRTLPWVVTNEPEVISWTTTGTVNNITIRYSTDGFVSDSHDIITNTANTSPYDWAIPNFGQGGITTTIRVYDANDDDINIGSYGETGQFLIDYYNVNWNFLDDVTQQNLDGIGTPGAPVEWGDGTSAYYLQSPVHHAYPYKTDYTTVVRKDGYSLKTIGPWTADQDKEMTVLMASSVIHQWGAIANFLYDASTDSMHVISWFEKDGLIQSSPLPDSVAIDIYDQSGNPVDTDPGTPGDQSLFSSSPNAEGVFHIDWNDTNLQENTTYWARVTLTYSGQNFYGAMTYDINIPVKLQNIKTTSDDIKDDTTQIVSTTALIQQQTEVILPEQLDSLKDSIRSLVDTKISNLADDVEQVRIDVGYVRSDVSGVGDDIQSYMIDRPNSVKSGDSVPIKFQGPDTGLAPTVDVYDPKNKLVVPKAVMTEILDDFNNGTGVYEYELKTKTGWGKGDFTVVVNEPDSGATDSTVLSIVGTTLDEIKSDTLIAMSASAQKAQATDKLLAIEGGITALMGQVSQLEAGSSATAQETTVSEVLGKINTIAIDLSQISKEQGVGFSELSGTVIAKTEGIDDLRKKLKLLDELKEYNLQILDHLQDKWFIYEEYDWGSIILNIHVVNNETRRQTVQVKHYLPREITMPEHVEDLGG